jgi:hypothetical protein
MSDNDRSVPAAPRYHPAAQGFTGDALDQLCKSRFTEGVEVGRAEAAEAALQVIEERAEAAREEGHREGQEFGEALARNAIRESMEGGHFDDAISYLVGVRDRAKGDSLQADQIRLAIASLEQFQRTI